VEKATPPRDQKKLPRHAATEKGFTPHKSPDHKKVKSEPQAS
jgi:hypothetical protein